MEAILAPRLADEKKVRASARVCVLPVPYSAVIACTLEHPGRREEMGQRNGFIGNSLLKTARDLILAVTG